MPPETLSRADVTLDSLSKCLVCPRCANTLVLAPTTMTCTGCGAAYPINSGVPRLAVLGAADTWNADIPPPATNSNA